MVEQLFHGDLAVNDIEEQGSLIVNGAVIFCSP